MAQKKKKTASKKKVPAKKQATKTVPWKELKASLKRTKAKKTTKVSKATSTPAPLPTEPRTRLLPKTPVVRKIVGSDGRVGLQCKDCGRGFKTEGRMGRYPSRCPECHEKAYGKGTKLKKSYKDAQGQ